MIGQVLVYYDVGLASSSYIAMIVSNQRLRFFFFLNACVGFAINCQYPQNGSVSSRLQFKEPNIVPGT